VPELRRKIRFQKSGFLRLGSAKSWILAVGLRDFDFPPGIAMGLEGAITHTHGELHALAVAGSVSAAKVYAVGHIDNEPAHELPPGALHVLA